MEHTYDVLDGVRARDKIPAHERSPSLGDNVACGAFSALASTPVQEDSDATHGGLLLEIREADHNGC